MCVFVFCQALFSAVYLVFHPSLQTNSPLSQHCLSQRALVTESKAGIYASAWDKTYRKGIGTTDI